jgi:hypothetical protein
VHLAGCKKQALEYLERGDDKISFAIAALLSAMDKHPETKVKPGGLLTEIGMEIVANKDMAQARRFILGFR